MICCRRPFPRIYTGAACAHRETLLDNLPTISVDDLEALRDAKRRLEHPGLTARISNLVGRPMEGGLRMLPSRWHMTIESAAEAALFKGLEFAIGTMRDPQPRRSRDLLHRAVAAGTGAVGGALGVVSLPVELPVSTCVILRSIADIARSEGHDVCSIETQLACLEVFALGSPHSVDDAAESGYWVVRGVMSRYLSEAAEHISRKGLRDRSAPALIRLVTQIAARFGVVISEQAAARLIPVLGAASGGTVNYLFTQHFQDMARGHFVVRRLEKKYGSLLVQRAYEELLV